MSNLVASEASSGMPSRTTPLLTVGSVATAHFVSHFFLVAFAPVLPLVAAEFDISFTKAGLVFSALAFTSGFGQPVAGILVDRFGAHRILVLGLFLQVAGFLAMGFTTSFFQLLPLAVLSGIGNSVYHPADLSILSRRVPTERLGRAYATHAIAGAIGFAASPALIGWLALSLGWRHALILAAVGGLLIGAGLLLMRGFLRIEPNHQGRGSGRGAAASAGMPVWRVFLLPVVIAGFGAFTFNSLASLSVVSFGVTILGGYGYAIATAGFLVAAFQIGAIGGVMTGGILAERTSRHHVVAMTGAGVAAAFILGLSLEQMPMALLIVVLAASGAAFGVIQPSRDILLRSAAPPERLGAAIGAAYSGLDAGALIGPLIYGPLLDLGRPDLIFVGAALFMAASIFTLGRIDRARRSAGA